MVKVRKDMTGWNMWEHGFPNSKITVVKQAEDYISPQGCRYARWWCKCSCGNPRLFIVKGRELLSGDTQSCGCIKVKFHKKYNEFELNLTDNYGDYGIGYCTNTNNKFYFDMEDYDKIKDYCWYEIKVGNYHNMEAWDKTIGSQIKMYWIIFDKYCDHIDRNPLNNRKYNLRQATPAENSANKSITKRNTSGIIGVCWDKSRDKWISSIKCDGKNINLGRFVNKEDAIRARLEAEQKYFKEFAPQRHLFEQYGITEQNDCTE